MDKPANFKEIKEKINYREAYSKYEMYFNACKCPVIPFSSFERHVDEMIDNLLEMNETDPNQNCHVVSLRTFTMVACKLSTNRINIEFNISPIKVDFNVDFS